MLVRDRMTKNPVTVGPQEMLATAQEKMTSGRFRRLPVVENGVLIGIMTDRDVRRYVGSEERTKVRAIMTETPLTISPDLSSTELQDRKGYRGVLRHAKVERGFLGLIGVGNPACPQIDQEVRDTAVARMFDLGDILELIVHSFN